MDDLFAVFEENKNEEDIDQEEIEKPKKRALEEPHSTEDENESTKRSKVDPSEEKSDDVQEKIVYRKTQKVQIDEFR